MLARSQAGALLCAVLLATVSRSASAQGLVPVEDFGQNPGALRMYVYLPAVLRSPAPLVVVLHGCSQQAADFDDESGWTQVAERLGLALLLPEQRGENNSSLCFNWFEPGDTSRDEGEVRSIVEMVDRVQADHDIDSARVFATGVSSGGAMAAALLAAYPDRFAGGAVMAGIPYGCASGLFSAFSCMSPGLDLEPSVWGDRVRAASDHAGPWPVVSIWQGDADGDVAPLNAQELAEQWTDVHGADAVVDATEQVGAHRRDLYLDAEGALVVERYTLVGVGHGMPVDPGSGAAQCGQVGTYFVDVDLCASLLAARFWGLVEPALPDGGAEDAARDDASSIDLGSADARDAAVAVDGGAEAGDREAGAVDASADGGGAGADGGDAAGGGDAGGADRDAGAVDTDAGDGEGSSQDGGCDCATPGARQARPAAAGLALSLLLRRRGGRRGARCGCAADAEESDGR